MAFSNTAAKYSAILLYSSAIAFIVVLVVAAFNPGCTNVDTLDMWGQAHSRIYHDWHPVALTIMMTYLTRIHDGFQPVIVLQTLLFIFGIFLTIRKYSTPLLGVALLLAVAVFPPVFFWLGFVGKDPFMACWLIFGIGALYQYTENGSRTFFWLGVAALYLGFAVRHNGIFAVLPLLVWALLRRSWPRIVLAIALIVLGFTGLNRVVQAAFHVQHEYVQQCGFLYDLAALSVRSGTMLVPAEFQKPGITLVTIQKELDPFNDGWLFWGPDSVIRLTADPADMKNLYRDWATAVLAHPGTYLSWRWDVFQTYTGLAATELEPYIESCIVPNELGLAPVDSRLHLWVMNHLQPIGQSILFRPYLYLSILLIFIVQGMWLKRWDTTLIAFAGLSYSLAYFIFGQSSNFRLACFSNFVAILLLVRLVAERVGGKMIARSKMQATKFAAWHVGISVALLVALLEVAHLAQPQSVVLAERNLITNTDFESGALAPWKSFQEVHASVNSDHAHGGNYSLAEGDAVGSVYQDVHGLEPGRRYQVTVWVSASPGATATARIAVWDPVANVASYSDVLSPRSGWQPLTQSVVAGSSGTLRVHLFREAGSGTVYWDDVHIYEEK